MALNDEAIKRRIKFLLDEASSPNPEYCHTISTTMRMVSNWLIFGNWSSRYAKLHAKLMSREALRIREKYSESEFMAKTINEHRNELHALWSDIKKRHKMLSIDEVEMLLKNCLPVVVTKEENGKLTKSKMRGRARYEAAGIDVRWNDGNRKRTAEGNR
jgi:hypothetical protein